MAKISSTKLYQEKRHIGVAIQIRLDDDENLEHGYSELCNYFGMDYNKENLAALRDTTQNDKVSWLIIKNGTILERHDG